MSDVKKAKAAATRADDLVKEQERANLKQAREKEVKEQAAKVREQTADDVTDTAKRVFYEQRLATAKATKCAPARESAGRVRGRRGRVQGGREAWRAGRARLASSLRTHARIG